MRRQPHPCRRQTRDFRPHPPTQTQILRSRPAKSTGIRRRFDPELTSCRQRRHFGVVQAIQIVILSIISHSAPSSRVWYDPCKHPFRHRGILKPRNRRSVLCRSAWKNSAPRASLLPTTPFRPPFPALPCSTFNAINAVSSRLTESSPRASAPNATAPRGNASPAPAASSKTPTDTKVDSRSVSGFNLPAAPSQFPWAALLISV